MAAGQSTLMRIVAIHAALRRVLENDDSVPTALELYRELEAVTPDSLQYLLLDLFETDTRWKLQTKQDVKAHRVESQDASRENERRPRLRQSRILPFADSSAPAMPDVEHLNDVGVDRKQDPVDMRPATIEQLPYFNR